MAKLPTVVSSIPRDLRMFLDRVREALNASGDDELLTVGTLRDAGVIQYRNGRIEAEANSENYPTPPAPLNLTASGALASVLLSWGEPTYYGHAYAEVWAAQAPAGGGNPAIGDAVLIGITAGSVFTHVLGGGDTRWYWVRFVNRSGVAGAYNAVEGVQGSTGQDPAYLLELLTGQLTESQLYQTLGDRIDLIDAGTTVVGSVAYRIAQEAAARAAEISAEATARANALVAEAAARGTAITAEETARVAADDALSSQITTLTATVSGNTAAIQTEETARVTADSALSSQITTLATTVSGNTAAIQTEETARVAADDALSSQITTLTATVSGNTAAIQTEETARISADGALASSIASLSSALTTAQGDVGANATAINALDTRVTTAEGSLTSLASSITSLSADLSAAETDVSANASAITALDTRVTNAEGLATSTASSVTTLQSTVNSNTSAIQTEATTRASQTGSLFAQYTVKVDTNGYVAGFGLASTATTGTPTSEFIVRSDKFAIASPSGPGITPYEPFIVRTTATTINGETVPAGVYIKDAAIQNGTITNAKIGDLAVDTAKIADLSVTTAKIVNLAVTTAKITDASITNAKIANASITTAKIADAQITNAKIANATIDVAKINKATITNLSSLNANMGTITAGKMQSTDGLFVIDLDNKTISIET